MPQKLPSFVIGIPIYPDVDLLDVSAPCELFQWMKESVAEKMAVEIHVVAKTKAPVKTRGGLRLVPQRTFAEVPKLDLLWVPGGDLEPLKKTMSDKTYLGFLRSRSRTAIYVTSVYEGALLLASAGLLAGHRVTTHWAFVPCLRRFRGVRVAPGHPRFVVSQLPARKGKKRYLVTGGGISSGLDEALQLIKMIAGRKAAEGVQLNTQYYPEPPVSSRIPKTKSCPLDVTAD